MKYEMKYLKLVKKFKLFRKFYNWINPFAGVILMLHRVVSERSLISDNRLLEVTPEFLEYTILKYKNEGYEFVSLDCMLEKQKTYAHKPYICFTFDDGYRDNLKIALPIFEKYEIPFAIYIATNFIEQKSFLWWYVLENIIQKSDTLYLRNGLSYPCRTSNEKNETFNFIKKELQKNPYVTEQIFYQYIDFQYRSDNYEQPAMLDWDNIITLLNTQLCTIASHGVTHSSLTIVTDDVLNFELKDSKKIIEAKTGIVVKHFAYPYGDMNKKVVKAVKKAGYLSAVKIDGGIQRRFQNSFFFKRFWLQEL